LEAGGWLDTEDDGGGSEFKIVVRDKITQEPGDLFATEGFHHGWERDLRTFSGMKDDLKSDVTGGREITDEDPS
jgi:hypothetical protein